MTPVVRDGEMKYRRDVDPTVAQLVAMDAQSAELQERCKRRELRGAVRRLGEVRARFAPPLRLRCEGRWGLSSMPNVGRSAPRNARRRPDDLSDVCRAGHHPEAGTCARQNALLSCGNAGDGGAALRALW